MHKPAVDAEAVLVFDFWTTAGIPYTWHPKNKTIKWFCTDTEDQATFPADFDYSFNQWGYRINDVDWNFDTTRLRLVTLGCSISAGVGVSWSSSWPVLLQKHLNCDLFNLSVAGASSETVVRTLLHSVDVIKPDLVLIYWPDPIRFEDYENIVESDCEGNNFILPKFRSIWDVENTHELKENQLMNLFIKNKQVVQLIKQVHDFKLVDIDSKSLEIEYLDLYKNILDPYSFDARDGMHPGITQHKFIADAFIKLL
jgi:hypothetical protein